MTAKMAKRRAGGRVLIGVTWIQQASPWWKSSEPQLPEGLAAYLHEPLSTLTNLKILIPPNTGIPTRARGEA